MLIHDDDDNLIIINDMKCKTSHLRVCSTFFHICVYIIIIPSLVIFKFNQKILMRYIYIIYI